MMPASVTGLLVKIAMRRCLQERSLFLQFDGVNGSARVVKREGDVPVASFGVSVLVLNFEGGPEDDAFVASLGGGLPATARVRRR